MSDSIAALTKQETQLLQIATPEGNSIQPSVPPVAIDKFRGFLGEESDHVVIFDKDGTVYILTKREGLNGPGLDSKHVETKSIIHYGADLRPIEEFEQEDDHKHTMVRTEYLWTRDKKCYATMDYTSAVEPDSLSTGHNEILNQAPRTFDQPQRGSAPRQFSPNDIFNYKAYRLIRQAVHNQPKDIRTRIDNALDELGVEKQPGRT